ncbi:MAG: hypothetical protein KF812_09090 [Fimbriimonadaceae bacterium]|nr:hypothetical protein [Fimbriimonadaceae bacterium]
MSVPNVECHLARAQMKRYIGGASLPDEVLGELERHLHACPECLAEAQRMKEALLAGNDINTPAPTPASPVERIKSVLAGFADKLPGQKPVAARDGLIPQPGTPLFKENRVNLRILATSAALALTLIAMSTILRDPTRLLGEKVPAAANTPPAVADEHEETTTEEETNHEESDSTDAHEDEHSEEADAHESTELDESHDESNHESNKSDAATHGTTPAQSGSSHGASGTGQSTGSSSQSNSGLSLPGRPTMSDSPVVTADSRSGVSTHAAPATPPRRTTHQATPRRTTPTRRPARPSGQSNSSSTPRSPVTVYNPDGTKK